MKANNKTCFIFSNFLWIYLGDFRGNARICAAFPPCTDLWKHHVSNCSNHHGDDVSSNQIKKRDDLCRIDRSVPQVCEFLHARLVADQDV